MWNVEGEVGDGMDGMGWDGMGWDAERSVCCCC